MPDVFVYYIFSSFCFFVYLRRTEPSFESDAWNVKESAYVGVCDSQKSWTIKKKKKKKSMSMCFFSFSNPKLHLYFFWRVAMAGVQIWKRSNNLAEEYRSPIVLHNCTPRKTNLKLHVCRLCRSKWILFQNMTWMRQVRRVWITLRNKIGCISF